MSLVLLAVIPILGGAVLDLLFGDPEWLRIHPVRLIGGLIARLDRALYRESDPDTKKKRKGLFLVIVVLLLTGLSGIVLYLVGLFFYTYIHPVAGFLVLSLLTDTTLAAGSLRLESLRVYDALNRGLPEARLAVSRIVGRDTERLDEAGVLRATVETVAENASDGVIAPLFYLALGGFPLALFYKAVNTMDSMLGYKNERYLYFGRAAAKLDDVCNFLPARLTALLFCLTAPLIGLDGKEAFRIWKRDRANHDSPNSAQPESACAGALHLRLAGDAYYFGKKKEKPTIGDDDRPIEKTDVKRANRLMLASGAVMLLLAVAIRLGIAALVYL